MRVMIIIVVIACELVACRGGEDNSCPPGTEPLIETQLGDRIRTCIGPSAQPDGPVVRIDDDGREHRIGQWVGGKMHGVWRSRWRGAGGETVSDQGRLVSRSIWDETFTPVHLSKWSQGVPHGPFLIRRMYPTVFLQGELTHGRRSGTWRRSGAVTERWTYDAQGVMQTFDGKPIAPPPEAIGLTDGTVVQLSSCGSDLESPCLDLFEAFQRYDGDPCRQRAIAAYARR